MVIPTYSSALGGKVCREEPDCHFSNLSQTVSKNLSCLKAGEIDGPISSSSLLTPGNRHGILTGSRRIAIQRNATPRPKTKPAIGARTYGLKAKGATSVPVADNTKTRIGGYG